MPDPFSTSNNRARAKSIIDERKAAEEETVKASKAKIAAANKPKFNDIPVYRPVWRI